MQIAEDDRYRQQKEIDWIAYVVTQKLYEFAHKHPAEKYG